MEEDSWDVLHDLQFLFASDAQLNDELSYVCHLLSDSSGAGPAAFEGCGASSDDKSGPCSASPAPQPKPKRVRAKVSTEQTFRTRQLREMKELRIQVEQLKRQLVELPAVLSQRADASPWERAARDQSVRKCQSIQQNEQLRAAVHEHATFIDDMTRLLRKKPRLTLHMDTTTEAWQICRLAAHTSLRVAAIHAIADKQFGFAETKFIRAGVFDHSDDFIRARPLPQVDGSVVIEYVYHVTLAAPCHLISDAVWNVLNGTAATPVGCTNLVDGAVETFEFLDANTLYRTFTKTRDDEATPSGRHVQAIDTAHSNTLYKRYHQHDRHVMVWKSVLEDALMPHMTNGAVHDESGWIVVTPITASTSRLTLLVHIVADPVHEYQQSSVDDLVDAAAEIFDKFSFMEPPDTPGTFPGAPVKEDKAFDMSFAKQTFVRRGKQLELDLKHAINAVVRDHQATDS